ALSEGGAAQAVQARLVGSDLDHHQANVRRRGQNGFDVEDFEIAQAAQGARRLYVGIGQHRQARGGAEAGTLEPIASFHGDAPCSDGARVDGAGAIVPADGDGNNRRMPAGVNLLGALRLLSSYCPAGTKGGPPMNTILTTARCPVCGLELPETNPLRCVRPGCGVELETLDDARLAVRTFRLHDHFSLCVLPFSFEEERRGEVVERLDRSPRWTERQFSLARA